MPSLCATQGQTIPPPLGGRRWEQVFGPVTRHLLLLMIGRPLGHQKGMSQRRGFNMPYAGSIVPVALVVGQRIQSIKMVRRRIIAHPAQREGFGGEIAETYPDALRGWFVRR